jgi:multiple sugar transport system permease protein
MKKSHNSLQGYLLIAPLMIGCLLFYAIIFSLINAFKCFREIFLIGGTQPNENIYML